MSQTAQQVREPVAGTPRPGAALPWQRAEGAAVLAAALVAYTFLDASWLLFAALLLAPDLGMLGYLAGRRVGAMTYNAVHVYAGPAAALLAGVAGVAWALPVGVIWLAHIGMDRALGYGLKLPTGFKDTHMGRIGG
ncbi:MAG: DUF4260 domain-containing protein [Gemmatimonadetes bacterium]|nr:DUF4260 domain-containing protein [Gemmatimonadota bacterium]